MPCYEVRTVSVEFKADNRQLLDAAIKAAGLQINNQDEHRVVLGWGEIILNLDEGTARVQDGYQDKLNELKRAYSKECVRAAAKKASWNVKWSGKEAVVNKLKW